MKRRGNTFVRNAKNQKAPVITVCFGGSLLCFCFISHTLLVITLGFALIVLGVWLLKNI